jgi:hypothetical protein
MGSSRPIVRNCRSPASMVDSARSSSKAPWFSPPGFVNKVPNCATAAHHLPVVNRNLFLGGALAASNYNTFQPLPGFLNTLTLSVGTQF